MLTEKDYCDYGLIVELEQLGMPIDIDFACGIENGQLVYPNPPSLYEAKKWLREEKGLFVNVELFGDYDRDADGKTLGTWVYYSYGILNTTTADFIREYDLCAEYKTYEEALSEGIKEAVKILNEK